MIIFLCLPIPSWPFLLSPQQNSKDCYESRKKECSEPAEILSIFICSFLADPMASASEVVNSTILGSHTGDIVYEDCVPSPHYPLELSPQAKTEYLRPFCSRKGSIPMQRVWFAPHVTSVICTCANVSTRVG